MTGDDFRTTLLAKETAVMEVAVTSYEAFHKARFDFALAKGVSLCPAPSASVLDIGRSYLSLELLRYYDDVSTLGFSLEPHSFTGVVREDGSRKDLKAHIDFDLNSAQKSTDIDSPELFDLIVFAEVLEHLYTAPELTLFALKKLMKPGGFMIIQTPNAAAFFKRVLLLIGRNPYERIRINPRNPGHFREYTKNELIMYARQLDLEVVSHDYKDYFGWVPVFGGKITLFLFKALTKIMPSLSRGQTLVLRRPLSAVV